MPKAAAAAMGTQAWEGLLALELSPPGEGYRSRRLPDVVFDYLDGAREVFQ